MLHAIIIFQLMLANGYVRAALVRARVLVSVLSRYMYALINNLILDISKNLVFCLYFRFVEQCTLNTFQVSPNSTAQFKAYQCII